MKKLIAVASAVLLAGCSAQHAPAIHKTPACRVLQDANGDAYCAVATPAHTGANTSDSSMWLWYMLYLNSANNPPAGTSSIGTGSTWRPMSPGFTPPSLTKTDIAVRVDPKSQQPGEEPENAEQVQNAVVEDPEENPSPEVEVNEEAPADQAPADGPGNDTSGDTGGDAGGAGDAGGGDGGGS